MGALRIDELANIQTDHVKRHGELFLIEIPKTKTKKPKSFTIHGEYYNLVKKYMDLRPKNVPHNRLFLNFQKQKCTIQPIGKNKFASMPKVIAEFLGLPDANLYTGKRIINFIKK